MSPESGLQIHITGKIWDLTFKKELQAGKVVGDEGLKVGVGRNTVILFPSLLEQA